MMEMAVSDGVSLSAAFLMGLFAGAHCLMMCGGFVAALSGKPTENVVAVVKSGAMSHLPRAFSGVMAAQLGRMTTYLLLGALFGALGAVMVAYVLPTQRILATLAALMLLWIAVSIARGGMSIRWLESLGFKIYSKILSRSGANLRGNTAKSRYFLGMLWGMTPCGMVYSMLGLAMATGDAPRGMALMLAFGLGTLPNLFVAGVIFSQVKHFLQKALIRYAIALVIAGFALYSLNQLWLTDKMDRLHRKATTPASEIQPMLHSHGEHAMPSHTMPAMPDADPSSRSDAGEPSPSGTQNSHSSHQH